MLKKLPNLIDFDVSDKERSWKVEIDGKEIKVNKRLSIINTKQGRLDYAKSPLGYDTISFEEAGLGGAVLVPYFILSGELFVGFVEQDRPNQMDMRGHMRVYNLPRGGLEPGETFIQAAKRETPEELRLDTKKLSFEFKRLSRPLNSDSALISSVPEGKVGVEFFSLKINPNYLHMRNKNAYMFKEDMLQVHGDLSEKIYRSVFYHWTKVFDFTDMLSITGVLLLRLSLE